jgi:hypothetical protein
MISLNAPTECYGFDIIIDVAPNTLNLGSQGQVVTVHTDIGYSVVAGSTVTLNNVAISHWKADNRGYFVAKFLMDSIKDLPLIVNDFNTLTLMGLTVDLVPFSGEQAIMVVDNIPAGGQ